MCEQSTDHSRVVLWGRARAVDVRRHVRLVFVLLAVLSPATSGGCASARKPIFEPPDRPIVWPPAPRPARIRYVGQLKQAADLKPAHSFFKTLSNIFVGDEAPSPLYGPRAALCTKDGQRVWVADPGGRCLHLFDLDARTYRKVTRIEDQPLISPVGLCLGDGPWIYMCDSVSGSIYRLSSQTGMLPQTLRVAEDLNRPVALAYRPDAGELFVVDVTAHNIKVLDRDGGLLRIIGRRGTAPGEFNYPCAIADDGELLWIVDTGNHRIQGLTADGKAVVTFGQGGDAPGDLALPKGVAVDSDGHVYVVDARFENVQVFDRTGRLLLVFGQEGTGPGAFWLPSGIHIDGGDRIWVCDSYNRRIQVFDYLKAEALETQPRPGGEEDE